MANEEKKDFNKQLSNSKDMPKIIEITDKASIEKFGKKMLIAPPIDYDILMKKVPKGKIVTTTILRNVLAKKYEAEFTDTMTAGIFVNIVAWASHQRTENITPYWRTIKSDGKLNEKFPGGIESQKQKLIEEGFEIISKGRTKQNYFVKDFENFLFNFENE